MEHDKRWHEQYGTVRDGDGFIAALDQSGGSTPKALASYGVGEDAYSDEAEMFDRIHEMRTRIITSDAFDGDRVIGAILFEDTMNRQIEDRGSAGYLWEVKHVVPFLKVDKGLEKAADGVQLMKPIDGLDDLLRQARDHGVFGTKMRSVVELADTAGVQAVVDQQFEIARTIIDGGLVPILEPEVDIGSPEKEDAEHLLETAIREHLDSLSDDVSVMLKLTIPNVDGFYTALVEHPRVLRVVALSGGYSRDDANERLARNPGVIASFSRALTEGLSADQSDEEFSAQLDAAIEAIYRASVT